MTIVRKMALSFGLFVATLVATSAAFVGIDAVGSRDGREPSFYYPPVAQADHPVLTDNGEPWHVHGYHGCEWITFSGGVHNSWVPAQSLWDRLAQMLEQGWGWDAYCGNKFVWWGDDAHVYYAVEDYWSVYWACGGRHSWGCVVPHSCYWEGAAYSCKMVVHMWEDAFWSYPEYVINHETGHVLGLGDHGDCGYPGLMLNRPETCYVQAHWPTWWEWQAVDWRMWYGP